MINFMLCKVMYKCQDTALVEVINEGVCPRLLTRGVWVTAPHYLEVGDHCYITFYHDTGEWRHVPSSTPFA